MVLKIKIQFIFIQQQQTLYLLCMYISMYNMMKVVQVLNVGFQVLNKSLHASFLYT